MLLGSLQFGQSKSWSQKDASSSLLHTMVGVYHISSQGYCGYEHTDNLLGEEVATALKGILEPSETGKNHKNVDTIQQLKHMQDLRKGKCHATSDSFKILRT